jgi:hypothetical protein
VRGEPVATFISSRIIVDAAQFRQVNPNYARPSIIRAANSRRRGSTTIDLWNSFNNGPPQLLEADQIKVTEVDIDMQDEDNLMICSPTVLGYSLNDKL